MTAKPAHPFDLSLFGFSSLVASGLLGALALCLNQFVFLTPSHDLQFAYVGHVATPATYCGPHIPKLLDLTSSLDHCPVHEQPLALSKVRYSRRSYHQPSIPRDIEAQLFPFAIPHFTSTRWRTWYEGIMVEFSRCPDCATARWLWLEEHEEKNVDRPLPKAGKIDWSGFAIPLEPPVEASSLPNLEFAPLPVP